MKRVLLINPKKEESPYFYPHTGLAQLSAVINKENKCIVIDYSFNKEAKDINYYINEYDPEVIGISVLTTTINEARDFIKKIRSLKDIPIIIGGPHATLYSENLIKEDIDYIIKGEAENIINEVIKDIKRNDKPIIIKDKEIVNINNLPYPDYKSFIGYENMVIYPLLTSRGCPYRCSFCVCSMVVNRYRYRQADNIINELMNVKKDFGNIKILICDDSPCFNKEGFKDFLRSYKQKIGNDLALINTRADIIDNEVLDLLKQLGINRIALGVESANKEVYNMINKGESLEDIERACKLIKARKLILDLFFIIGLPKDNLNSVKESIKFFKRNKAEGLSLCMLQPFKNTKVYEQLLEEGTSFDSEIDFYPQILNDFKCPEPIINKSNFSKYEMEKAFYMFLLCVGETRVKFRNIKNIIKIVIKYNLYKEFLIWLPLGFRNIFRDNYRNVNKLIKFYKIGGIKYVKQRYKMYKINRK